MEKIYDSFKSSINFDAMKDTLKSTDFYYVVIFLILPVLPVSCQDKTAALALPSLSKIKDDLEDTDST